MNFYDDNHDMIAKEVIRLTNNGNATAKFDWLHTNQRIFSATPDKGEVPANSSLNVTITYKPS